MQVVCCQRCAVKFLLHRWALQYRLNTPLTVIYLFRILRSFFTTVSVSPIYRQNSEYCSFVSMNIALFQTVFSGSDNSPYTKQSKYNTGSELFCRITHYSTVHSACSGLCVCLLPHYKAASLTCGSSCSFVCVSSSRLLALCTNSMLSFLLCVHREVESAVVTTLLQTHCLPSHADTPAMTVHIGLTDMLTIAGNAVRCLFQFKQLNLRK